MGARVWSKGPRHLFQAEVLAFLANPKLANEECHGKLLYIYSDRYAALTTIRHITTSSKLQNSTERSAMLQQIDATVVINSIKLSGNIETYTLVRIGASGGGHKEPEPYGTLGELVKQRIR